MTDNKAKFLEGNLFAHVSSNTLFASAGLIAIFMVDLVDMYFLSLLGEPELAAAVGYAGTILFFTTSMCIGFSIAASALVARSLGAGELETARTYLVHCLTVTVAVTTVVTVVSMLTVDTLLSWLGASGRTFKLAQHYLWIVLPTVPLLAIGMACGGALRSAGDAKLQMWNTISAGLVNAILDPIFIFGFGWGLEGAALATAVSRVTLMLLAMKAVIGKHDLLGRFSWLVFRHQSRSIASISLPAIMTNLSTPIGGAYMMSAIAVYGDSAVAGYSVVGRLTPVAFCLVFALSGAIGPIIGQNAGAGLHERVQRTLLASVLFLLIAVLFSSALLFVANDFLIRAFGLQEDGAAVLSTFCQLIAWTFFFKGLLFIANAAFNNLGHAQYATFSNFGKATLGTIPFVMLGTWYWGAEGVLIGEAMGAICFGIGAFVLVWRMVSSPHMTAEGYEPARSANAAQHLGGAVTDMARMVQAGTAHLVRERGKTRS